MLERIRSYIVDHIRLVGSSLTGVVVVVWLLSRFSPALAAWMRTQYLAEVVILALVSEIWVSLIELKRAPTNERVQLSVDQMEASQRLVEYIERTKPRTADLIEVSAATVDSVLSSLIKRNCRIRLLLQNPSSAVNEYQRGHIQQRIHDLTAVTLKGYTRCEVRLYSLPCSIRGRLIDKRLVDVGWYTYSRDEAGVYGHTNPLITATIESHEGRELKRLFETAFEELWEHPLTIRVVMDFSQKSVTLAAREVEGSA